MKTGLKGKVVLVTGGAGGIGSAISKTFAQQGARVIIHYYTSKSEAENLAREIDGAAFGADLTDYKQVELMFTEILENEDKIDICVANAGNYPKESAPLWAIGSERWTYTIASNLTLTYNTCREFLKHASETKKGSLILVGSTAGIYGEAGHADYAAAKGAITSGFLKTLKNDIAQLGSGVRVNAVAPGWTVSQKKIKEGLDQKHVDRITSTMSMKKLAEPEDVANSIAVLASDSLSGHITGQVIEIAGGMEGRLVSGIK